MKPEDMGVVDINPGEVVKGNLSSSSDTKTHLEIYRAFLEVKGITHTHSINAVGYVQASMDVNALGTTNADYFLAVPCTRELAENEATSDYGLNTGHITGRRNRWGI